MVRKSRCARFVSGGDAAGPGRAGEAAAPPTDEYVRLKVEPPHVEFAYGGTVVGTEWTPVHSSLAPGVLSAAAGAAGVTLTQEGS